MHYLLFIYSSKKSSFRQDNVTTIVHMCLLDVLVRYSAVVSALFGRFRAQFGKATYFVRWTALSLPLGVHAPLPLAKLFAFLLALSKL